MPTPIPIPLCYAQLFGGGEMVVIFLLVLIFFGGEKLPEFARGLGKVMREFKRASSGIEAEIKKAMDEHPVPPPYVPPKSVNLLGPVLPPLPAEADPTPGHRIMEHPLPVEPEPEAGASAVRPPVDVAASPGAIEPPIGAIGAPLTSPLGAVGVPLPNPSAVPTEPKPSA
jgi:sec-independent protein translocase protein TatA